MPKIVKKAVEANWQHIEAPTTFKGSVKVGCQLIEAPTTFEDSVEVEFNQYIDAPMIAPTLDNVSCCYINYNFNT